MKIAYADHDIKRLAIFERYMREYLEHTGKTAEIDIYDDPLKLLINAQNGYNLIFICLTHSNENGVDVMELDISQRLRAYDPFTTIIFVKWINDHECEFIVVYPQRYTVDMTDSRSFFSMFDKVSGQYDIITYDSITVTKSDNSVIKVNMRNILYAEIVDHILKIHLHGGEIIEQKTTLKEFEQSVVGHSEFIKTHRSYIVNMLYISEITNNEIRFRSSADIVPVAKKKADFVSNTFRDFVKGRASSSIS